MAYPDEYAILVLTKHGEKACKRSGNKKGELL